MLIPILLLGLTATGSAFTFPAGAANGIYRAYYNDAGDEVHELISPDTFEDAVVSEREVAHNDRHSRQLGALTWCGCGISMNAYDTNTANGNLQSQVSGGNLYLPENAAAYAIYNTVVAFSCTQSFGQGTLQIDPDIVNGNDWRITQACGAFVPGTADTLYWYDYGYMNYSPGLDFCGAAKASSSNTCF